MLERTYIVALTGDEVTLDAATNTLTVHSEEGEPPACTSLFFPGCSLINYGAPLVHAVYDTLWDAGSIDGISLLCCGRILQYEENGKEKYARFESKFNELLRKSTIRRIVCACPNCARTLRKSFRDDEELSQIEIVALPQELADLGYRIDENVARRMLGKGEDEPVLLVPRDSCPDREQGIYARGMRDLLPDHITIEAAHNLNLALCCGASLWAIGNIEASQKMAEKNVKDAEDVNGDGIVTACLSCERQLTRAQDKVPVFHYLELLYDWRINWEYMSDWMTLRLLLDVDSEESGAVSEQAVLPDGRVVG